MKKTLVLGASANPSRYSHLAMNKLKSHGHEVIAIGKKAGEVNGINITKDEVKADSVDTITLYMNAENQKMYYDYIISLKPQRIIFNPGAENDELMMMANSKGIKTMNACTLVMLGTGQY